jgi:hypothetical protein
LLNGGLFTRDFLIEGICEQEAWITLDHAAVAAIRTRLIALFTAIGKLKNPTEAETEKELIWPLLEAIGWSDVAVQQNLSVNARDDVPDALLYADAAAKAKAAPLDAWQRFQHGLCVVEAKRWNRALDRQDAARKGEDGVPSTQMLRYLRRVDDVTKGPSLGNPDQRPTLAALSKVHFPLWRISSRLISAGFSTCRSAKSTCSTGAPRRSATIMRGAHTP